MTGHKDSYAFSEFTPGGQKEKKNDWLKAMKMFHTKQPRGYFSIPTASTQGWCGASLDDPSWRCHCQSLPSAVFWDRDHVWPPPIPSSITGFKSTTFFQYSTRSPAHHLTIYQKCKTVLSCQKELITSIIFSRASPGKSFGMLSYMI